MTREEAAHQLGDLALRLPNEVYDRYVESLAMAIKALQEPERKKGKWLSHYDYCKRKGYIPSGLIAYWWCDLCEQGVEHPTNFCPNCGAEMESDN